jgi:hypothetical protein
MKHATLDLHNKSLDIPSQIDHAHYVDWASGMYIWCNGLPCGQFGHFLEQGHQLVADKIYNHMTKYT